MHRTRIIAAMAGACLATSLAKAAETPPPTSAVTRSEQVVLDDANTDWTKLLSKQVSALYPPKAFAAKVSGLVRLKCKASETGDLSDCTVDSETPEGQGFGAAALKLIAYIRLKPHIENGEAVAGTVIVPLNFQPDASRPGPATPLP